MSKQAHHSQKPQSGAHAQMFNSAEEAWFWFILTHQARHDGAKITAGLNYVARPCEPADILLALDTLRRSRKVEMDHVKVLKHYGIRLMAPDPSRAREVRAARLWAEALERLEEVLITKKIVKPRAPAKNWWHTEIAKLQDNYLLELDGVFA